MLDTPLRIFQANLNRSSVATESLLEIAIREKADILAIQEPWLLVDKEINLRRTIAHPAFTTLLPTSIDRNRVLFFIRRQIQVEITPISNLDPDFQAISVQDKKGNSIQILNVYNEKDSENKWTNERALYPFILDPNTILLGDFNIRHPSWDPYGKDNSPRANAFISWLEVNNFELRNIPNVGTFYRVHLDNSSVLDLTFTKGTSLNRNINSDINWRTLETGSDHLAISLDIKSKDALHSPSTSDRLRYDTSKADWEGFSKELKDREQDLNGITDLDLLASTFSEIISTAAKLYIPKLRIIAKSKPWWTPELKELRKRTARERKKITSPLAVTLRSDKESYLIARNTYFQAIKVAKRDHWNKFLEKTDLKSVYKAFSYTKLGGSSLIPTINGQETFKGKCQALRSALFPSPPPDNPLDPNWDSYSIGEWQWGLIQLDEIQAACSSSKVKGKTPGPDGITQAIIQQAFRAIPDTFLKVYGSLLNTGYHPKCWREAIGFTLAKPGKPDYSIPKAYRIIALLNCLGKVSERILAKRLGILADTGPLLHDSQMGGRTKRSAVDTALLLTDYVERNRAKGKKTSVAFLDVKGAFDHVAKNRLLRTLIKLRLPHSIIRWTKSFLEQRRIQLSFDGQIEETTEVETGVPQGSPISPILFLIYIRDLFTDIKTVTPLSYIDDIALLTASTSLQKNAKILEKEVKLLTKRGAEQAIEFDLAKTELLHFAKGKGKDSSLTLPSGELIKPAKKAVRWLGIWFDSHLTFKEHIQIRASKALASFYRMNRLANIGNGLSTRSLRTLYLSCVTTVADYGAPVWWKSKRSIIPLDAIHGKGIRKVLGVFRTTPTEPTEREADLLTPRIRLERQVLKYSLRIKGLPEDNPIVRALRDTTPIVSRRKIESGYELLPPKEGSKLQGILRRLETFKSSSLTDKDYLNSLVAAATRERFFEAKVKKEHGPNSYFERFNYDEYLSLQIKCERAVSSAYYSIRLGHGFFREYLYRFYKTDDDKCRCGLKETPIHLLTSCRLYEDVRSNKLRNAAYTTLFLSIEGQLEVIDYIRKTGIATPKWYRERSVEFNELGG